eukprot:4026089-Amphidinium_carterae.1
MSSKLKAVRRTRSVEKHPFPVLWPHLRSQESSSCRLGASSTLGSTSYESYLIALPNVCWRRESERRQVFAFKSEDSCATTYQKTKIAQNRQSLE